MREIEVKILEINVEEIRKKLLDLGAEKVFEGEIQMTSYDFPDNRLEKKGEFIRLRKLGEKVELCHKGKKEDSHLKVREEIEITVNDFKDTVKILENIGLVKYYEGNKKRESYKLGKISFEIDFYPLIPPFLEIEAPSEEEVEKYVEKLGYTMKQTTNLSGYRLEKDYNEKNVTKN